MLFRQVVADTGGIFAALDKDGNVWGWSSSSKNEGKVPTKPTKMPVVGRHKDVKFAVLACGDDFLLALQHPGSGGRLFSWNLGIQRIRQTSDQFVLAPVAEFEDKLVMDIAAGGCTSMATVAFGEKRKLFIQCTKNPCISPP